MSFSTGMSGTVSVEDWIKGIAFSILASIIGSASKLAIRKSWLLEFELAAAAAQQESSASSSAAASATSLLTSNGSNQQQEQELIDTAALRTPALKLNDYNSRSHLDLNGSAVSTEREAAEQQHSHDGLWRSPVQDACPVVVVAQQEEVTEGIRWCCCCCCGSCGPTKTHSNQNKSIRQPLSQRHWYPWTLRMSGLIGMTFLNPLCCVLAMKYASPSILAPFSGLTLVWIVLLSRVLIGEEPTANQKLAAALIVAGEVMVAVFGDHTNDEGVTLDDVERSYRQLPFLLYFVAMFFWMLCLWRWMAAANTSLFLKRFAWGVSGGSITGLQNFLKDALTIGKAKHASSSSSSSAEDDAGWPWYLMLFIFLAVATAFGGLLLLTACMKRYDATYSSAMFVGSFVVSASVMSAVHYRTFQNLVHVWNYVMYPMGLMVLMAGVLILVHETKEHSADDNKDVDETNGHATLANLTSNDLEQLLHPNENVDDNESELL